MGLAAGASSWSFSTNGIADEADNDVHLNRDRVTRAYFTKSQTAVVVAWYDLQCCGCVTTQLDRLFVLPESSSPKLTRTQLPDLLKFYLSSLVSSVYRQQHQTGERRTRGALRQGASLAEISAQRRSIVDQLFSCVVHRPPAYIKVLQSTSFSGWDHGFECPLWSLSSPLISYQYWCESCCLSCKSSYPSVASPSSYWEVWRSPVWPWTFSSCSSTPFFCAADGTKTRSNPTPTAAARPGVSSSPHLSAGWYKRCFSRRSAE